MTHRWKENWERSYRVTFGTREYKKSEYNIPSSLVLPNVPTDDITVPSNAVVMSNLIEDGNNRRGFSFKLHSEASLESSSNGGEKSFLYLYNLDEKSVEILNQDKCIVMVEAGYQQEVVFAYSGDVSSVKCINSGNDKTYKIQCASGAFAMRNTFARIEYDETVSEKDIILDMAKRFPGTALGTYGLDDLSGRYKTGGKYIDGMLVTEFDKLMARNNLQYAHINGKIVIVPYRLRGADYDAFARTNYTIPLDAIKEISDISDKTSTPSSNIKSKMRKLQINTFYIPVELGQFITIPESERTKEHSGTYQVKGRTLALESQRGNWDVILKVEEVG